MILQIATKLIIDCTSSCVYCKDITSIRVLNALLCLEISKEICNIPLEFGQVIFKILIKLVYEQPHNRKPLSY